MATRSFSGSLSTSGGYSSSSIAYQGTYSGGKARTGKIVFSGLSVLSGATITAASITVSYGGAGSERYKTFGGLWRSSVIAFENSETRTDSFILSDVQSAANGSGTITYTFTDPETSIDSGDSWTDNYGSITSATLNVTYSVLATYTISYNANGGSPTPSSQTKTQGTAITLTTTKPSKSSSSGSYIVRCYDNGSVLSTLYSTYSISYSFAYWSYGGSTYSSGASFNVDANCTLTAIYSTTTGTPSTVSLPGPTKTGHTLKGWYTAASGGTKVADGGTSYRPYSSINLYAQWEPNTYTVSYNANGGSGAPSSQTKTYGTALTLSSTRPTRSNTSSNTGYTVSFNYNGGSGNTTSLRAADETAYSFTGWNTNSSGTGTSYSPGGSYTANASVTLYAQWSTSIIDGPVTLPTPNTASFGTFKGWYTAASGGTKVGNAGASYTPSSNTTLYAQWNYNTYTVSYNANGGTGAPSNQTKTHGTNLTLSSTTPSRENAYVSGYTVTFDYNGSAGSNSSLTVMNSHSYSFSTWNTNANGIGVDYAPGEVYTANSDLTLYAQYNTTVTPGKLTLPTPDPLVGKIFDGWFTALTGGTRVGGENELYTPTSSLTLYAIWKDEISDSTITYNANGGSPTPSAQIKPYGESITLSSIVPSKTAIVEATYNLIYNNNMPGSSDEAHPDVVQKVTSYSFSHWNTAIDGSGNSYNPEDTYSNEKSVTLYAQYNSTTGTSAFYIKTEVPTRDGFTFIAWNTSPDGTGTSYAPGERLIPTSNVKLYAIWREPSKTPIAVIKRYNSSLSAETVKVVYYTATGMIPIGSIKRWNGTEWEIVNELTRVII